MKRKIQSIGVSNLYELRNSNINSDEQKNPKKAGDNTVISGQKVRYCVFQAIDRLNRLDKDRGKTYVSNGDGINKDITVDIRADLGGYLHTKSQPGTPLFLGKRAGPLGVPMCAAINEQELAEDTFVRFESPWSTAQKETNEQRINGIPFSVKDMMPISMQIDVPRVGCVETSTYKGGLNLSVDYRRFNTIEETKRRLGLFVAATQFMTGFANRGRMDISNAPVATIVVFDPMFSSEFYRFHEFSPAERARLIADVRTRGGEVFTTEEGGTVSDVYGKALAFLKTSDLVDLSDGAEISTYADLQKKYDELKAIASEAKAIAKTKKASDKKEKENAVV